MNRLVVTGLRRFSEEVPWILSEHTKLKPICPSYYNSVVMTWCFEDEKSDFADFVLDRIAAASALVPAIWPIEVVNVLWVAEQKKRLTTKDSVRFIELLRSLPIKVEYETTPDRMQNLLGLARAANLSSYDASYLDLAMRHDLPIATSDQRLKQAALSYNVQVLEAG